MSLGSLTICSWDATSCDDTVILDPGWPEIESAVRSLDNERLNDVYLTPLGPADEVFLCVGGGAGRYLVTGSDSSRRSPILSVPGSSSDALVPLRVGGQLGEFPARYVVDLDSALTAAKKFFLAGGFECGVPWKYR
jgi:hypothetical protein